MNNNVKRLSSGSIGFSPGFLGEVQRTVGDAWRGVQALRESGALASQKRPLQPAGPAGPAGKLLPKANVKLLRDLRELELRERGGDLGARGIVSTLKGFGLGGEGAAPLMESLVRLFQAAVDERGRVRDERIYQQAIQFLDGFLWRMRFVPGGRNSRVIKSFELAEGPEAFGWQLNNLADLAAAGLVHRFRCCKYCNRWLFARFTSQQFCSGGKCEKKYRESRAEYKQAHNTIANRSYHVRQKNKAQQQMNHGTREERQSAREKFQKHKEWLERNERK